MFYCLFSWIYNTESCQVRFRLRQIEKVAPNFTMESLSVQDGRRPDLHGLLPSWHWSGLLPSGQRLKYKKYLVGRFFLLYILYMIIIKPLGARRCSIVTVWFASFTLYFIISIFYSFPTSVIYTNTILYAQVLIRPSLSKCLVKSKKN